MEEISVIYKKFNIRMRVIQSHLRDFVIEMNEDNTKVYDKSFCKALQTLINKWNNIENATIDYFYDMILLLYHLIFSYMFYRFFLNYIIFYFFYL